METAVITKKIEEVINSRRVLAALFTTYNFEPDFFELEVIPVLLQDQNCSVSNDAVVKRYMVRDALRKEGIPIEVFFDAPMFNENKTDSPQMEYLHHGVTLGGSAFHPKLIFLLVEDADENASLLIAAGSNNLSKSAWWGDNIECQHWVEVDEHNTQRFDLNRYQSCMRWLNSKRSKAALARGVSAIERIENYLNGCKGDSSADYHFFYGPNDGDVNANGFVDYLRKDALMLGSGTKWTLEVISPFFADDADNDLHKQLLRASNIERIVLLLPKNDKGVALCSREYYEAITDADYIQWGNWLPEMAKALGLTDQIYRRLHAKVYRFYNGQQSWIFAGSVNFTRKAFESNRTSGVYNAEAGFLCKGSKGPWLEEIPESEQVIFSDGIEQQPGLDIKTSNPIPLIYMAYDWVTGKVSAYTEQEQPLVITVYGSEGEEKPLLEKWQINQEPTEYPGVTESLRKQLTRVSLLHVKDDSGSPEPFPSHVILVQQTGWSHKAIPMEQLSAAQILSIYSGLGEEKRQLMLMNACIRNLIKSGYALEDHAMQDEDIPKGFFCEYAEIFYAFRQLKLRLQELLVFGKENDVDYYLSGGGMDSLPALMDRALLEADTEDKKAVDGVTAYLILLCIKDLISNPSFADRINIRDKHAEVISHIDHIKRSGRIRLELDSGQTPEMFYDWFEHYFFMEIRPLEVQEEVASG